MKICVKRWRGQISPSESPNTCLSLRAAIWELMLAATASSSLRATTLSLRTTTRELILMLSSLSLRVTTSVRPTPGGFFFCLFCQGGLLPCVTTLSLRVTMRSNKDEVPLPMAGRGQCPNCTRARCLLMGEEQRRTFLPAHNVHVVLLRRRGTYEGARAPRCGARPPSPLT